MTYASVDNVSDELKGLIIDASSNPSSTVVADWISQADSEIELRTGKVWESTAFSDTLLDADGSDYFRFPFAPVTSISSFEYEENGVGADSESWVNLTEGRTEDFILHINDGEIEFTGKTQKPPRGVQNVRVSGSKGNSVVPPRLTRLSTLIVAKRVMEATINASSQEEGGSVTVGNISITDPSNFGISHVKNVLGEIQSIYDDIAGTQYVYRPSRNYGLRG